MGPHFESQFNPNFLFRKGYQCAGDAGETGLNLGMKNHPQTCPSPERNPMSFLIWERALWVILPIKQDGPSRGISVLLTLL